MIHVTIKDVARELGCSVSTVSRAFNDKYDIKKETKELILNKAKEMGYHPNPIAKKLITKKTYNIGVVVPEFVNSFFPEVIIGIQDLLIKEGYQVLIMQSNECYKTEMDNIKTLENNMVDGLLISLSRETKNIEFYSELYKKGMPMVFFNRVSDDIPGSKVIFDDFKWSFFATEHLIKQGYKKIYHLSGYKNLGITRNRIRGFKKALDKHRIPYNSNCIIETGLFIEEGDAVVEKLIRENNLPEAFFCINDPVAIGAMKALKRNKYKIPGDVAIVGFTESRMVEVVDPPLTSVIQPTFEMGRKAAEILLKQISAKEIEEAETIILEGKLNIRESSMNCNG